jgi:hypothetical protein
VKSDKISGTKKGVKCEVIECEATGDRLYEPLYEQLGQMDKYSSRTHFEGKGGTLCLLSILYYPYCMML